MEEFNNFEIFFSTRNSCVIKVPKNLNNKNEIRDFIIDKIVGEELECWIDRWFDFEIEEFEIVE